MTGGKRGMTGAHYSMNITGNILFPLGESPKLNLVRKKEKRREKNK
jgi:hypothetical protein